VRYSLVACNFLIQPSKLCGLSGLGDVIIAMTRRTSPKLLTILGFQSFLRPPPPSNPTAFPLTGCLHLAHLVRQSLGCLCRLTCRQTCRFLSELGSSNPCYVILYRVSQEECAKLRESVPFVKIYRYNPKHLYPKLNGYGDNGQRKVEASCSSKYSNLHS
jgi:hypothetical protein